MKQQDHFWASLTYAQKEGHAPSRAVGHAEGIEEAV